MRSRVYRAIQTGRLCFGEWWDATRRCWGDVGCPPLESASLQTLESRVMLSASPAAVAVEAVAGVADAAAEGLSGGDGPLRALSEHQAIAALGEDAPHQLIVDCLPGDVATAELIVIDSAMEDVEQWIESLKTQSNSELHTLVLDSALDGVQQISDALEQLQTSFDAIHLLTHGRAGEIQLGSTVLSNETLAAYAGQLAEWANGLSEQADLLIYGCNVAASDAGVELLEGLSASTGADVAASEDATGNAALGGDWELEYQLGLLQTDQPWDEAYLSEWGALLALAPLQDGAASGYVGTVDTYIDGHESVTPHDDSTTLHVSSNQQQTLIRFEDLQDQIPYGATINSAVLTFDVVQAGELGSTISLYAITQDWSQYENWNSLGNGIQLDNVEAGSTPLAQVSGDGPAVFSSAALTATIQNWADGGEFYGFVLVGDNATEWIVSSSEATTVANRPQLLVDYDPSATTRTITVTTVNDTVDAGDLSSFDALIADPGGDGEISLREAILATAPSGQSEIILGAGVYRFQAGANAIDINENMVIRGAGADQTIIDADYQETIFRVNGSGVLEVVDLTLTHGANPGRGGAIDINNGGVATLRNVVLTENTAGNDGGAISNEGALVLDNVWFHNNHSDKQGGAIYNDGDAELRNVSITNNTADEEGGGIYQRSNGSSLTLDNVTISTNTSSREGGGLYAKDGSVLMRHVTIAQNTAVTGGGIYIEGNANVFARSSLFANNIGGNSDSAIQSRGFNIDSGFTLGLTTFGDMANVNPQLKALAHHGGIGLTHGLAPNSAAINTGASLDALAVDGRGVARDVLPDIGALGVRRPPGHDALLGRCVVRCDLSRRR